ncbi:unnamed protein product [Leptosia nina]|uniref:RING-type domain-containing protein n=1 Tax=Leptosia nina TaxID=320188 RepID=A0AAV1JI14_9NEOP
MAEKFEEKAESLLNLDDLLQCPVCYEIPTAQIFQCNEGHHVCGRCKMRLDVCPVCRAFFFGTRNYAMEELIANFNKLKSFKSRLQSGGSGSSESSSTPVVEAEEEEENHIEEEDTNSNVSTQSRQAPPPACKGLFRCLCCKNGSVHRLPSGRLLNHLRYYHRPDLIEGHTENDEYLQAWQFPTVAGKLVTAVRIVEMGVFFLTIEIVENTSLHAWLTMASSPWVAHGFIYSVTISGNDREAIFSDCVWSVRSCEGSLKKRGHCLAVTGTDAHALLSPAAISGKLSVRRLPIDQLSNPQHPRAVLRVANRRNSLASDNAYLEPFLQGLQNDVARLTRAFVTLSREANFWPTDDAHDRNANPEPASDRTENDVLATETATNTTQPLSRSARRRMRNRLRTALDAPQTPGETARSRALSYQQMNDGPESPVLVRTAFTRAQEAPAPPIPPPTPASSSSGPSNGQPQSANRPNKKKRRHRR